MFEARTTFAQLAVCSRTQAPSSAGEEANAIFPGSFLIFWINSFTEETGNAG